MIRHRFSPIRASIAMLAFSAGLGGCVRRELVITSQPPGALVHVNDVEIGRTPVRAGFKFYGVYDIRLELDGYEPLWTSAEAESPWYETPGIDAVALAIPADIANEVRWHFEMAPLTEPDDDAILTLIGRAKELEAGL